MLHAAVSLLLLTAPSSGPEGLAASVRVASVRARFELPQRREDAVEGELLATLHSQGIGAIELSFFRPGKQQVELDGILWSHPDEVIPDWPGTAVLAPTGGERHDLERWVLSVPEPLHSEASLELRLQFRIRSWLLREEQVRLPLPVLELPLDRPSGGGLFSCEIVLPPGRALVAGFPAGLERTQHAGPDSVGVYRLAGLPVVPRFLAFEVMAGEPPLLTAARLVDGLTVVLLLGILAAGWLRFRSLVE